MIKVDTNIVRSRGAHSEVCQRGHSRWGTLQSGFRYCLDCETYRQARTKFQKLGQIGSKSVLVLEEAIDFQIFTLEAHIVELKSRIEKLNTEKSRIRKAYEDRLAKRRKAKK